MTKWQKIKHMTIIKYSSNKGFSGNLSILLRSSFGVGGPERSPQSHTPYSLNR